MQYLDSSKIKSAGVRWAAIRNIAWLPCMVLVAIIKTNAICTAEGRLYADGTTAHDYSHKS